ncbi:MAG: RluA family pseudouridine synthase [Desulfobacterota bacterium]|nr:RluA family pseudouridine synthase [Thermodesulfobacteriota bacterium]
MDLDVLFADNHVLVINKQAGILAQPDITGKPDILSLAKRFIKATCHKPGGVYLGLVHRLDRQASGVMVLARTSKAASRLSACFRQHAAVKKYMVIVEGRCSGSGTFSDYIVKHGRTVSIVPGTHQGARYATLNWHAVASCGDLTLMSVELITGRPHQIRIQCAHRGLPLLGDRRYGSSRVFGEEAIALHCYMLGIPHPISRTFQVWTAPPPAYWRGYFDDAINGLIKAAHQGWSEGSGHS